MGTFEAQKAGLSFRPPATKDFSTLEGKTAFGMLLDNPQFEDLGGFASAMDGLDTADKREIYLAYRPVEPTGEGTDFVRAKDMNAMISRKTGDVLSIVSDAYKPVQDREIVDPLFDVAQARGLKTVGTFPTWGGTRISRGYVVFANPEFTVRLLEDYPDDVMLGIKWWNAHTRESGFGAEVFGVRTICVNYCLWGHIVGRFSQIHMGDVESVLASYEKLVDAALNASPILTDLVSRAISVEVEKKAIPDLLWGIQMPIKAIETISADVAGWVPEVKDLGLNAWTLYNATTAYLSYQPAGGTHLTQTEYRSRQAIRLLEEDHDRLIVKGRDRRRRYEGALKEKKVEYARTKAVLAPSGASA